MTATKAVHCEYYRLLHFLFVSSAVWNSAFMAIQVCSSTRAWRFGGNKAQSVGVQRDRLGRLSRHVEPFDGSVLSGMHLAPQLREEYMQSCVEITKLQGE